MPLFFCSDFQFVVLLRWLLYKSLHPRKESKKSRFHRSSSATSDYVACKSSICHGGWNLRQITVKWRLKVHQQQISSGQECIQRAAQVTKVPAPTGACWLSFVRFWQILREGSKESDTRSVPCHMKKVMEQALYVVTDQMMLAGW